MKISATLAPLKTMDRAILFTILVAASGYFVDIFDLLLFSVVRVPSLKSLGVADANLLSTGIVLTRGQGWPCTSRSAA